MILVGDSQTRRGVTPEKGEKNKLAKSHIQRVMLISCFQINRYVRLKSVRLRYICVLRSFPANFFVKLLIVCKKCLRLLLLGVKSNQISAELESFVCALDLQIASKTAIVSD